VPDIVFYVSSHGFGHAIRCAVVCRALLEAAPDLSITVCTTAPAWIFPPGVIREERAIDVGVVQPNSLEIDARATLERYAAQVTAEDDLIAREASWLRESGVRAVVADVPAAAFEIAARAEVPGIGLANFSWDWIYEPFVADVPEHEPLIGHLREQYGRATLLLRLPFAADLSAFPRIDDVPLIARRSSADRQEIRRRLGLPTNLPLVLFSFGGHASDGPDPACLAKLSEYGFVMTAPGEASGQARRYGPNLFGVPPSAEGFVDLLAASDAAIVKPGYGIVADLLANRVPALYVSREGYREEPVLAQALEAEGRAVPLSREALDALGLGPALDRLLALDRPWTDRPLDGAEVVARRILGEMGA
jgi:UDP:flavonoid glycosyltransferase YjiC (YdhE family)